MFLTLLLLSGHQTLCVCVCVCVCMCVCVFEVCPTYPVAPCGRDAHHILEEDKSSSCVVCVKRVTSVLQYVFV